jgi:hypothetical protein
MVRRFDLNGTAAPTLAATRSLGGVEKLVGLAVANGQVIVGGNVAGATINLATVAQPYTGLADGFVAMLSTDLTASAGDTVAYVGTDAATQTATALALANGQAYLTGTVAEDPESIAAAGATEGFVVGIDTSTGATSYSAKFSGANGQAAPGAIAVGASGVSVLDQLGLPQGTVNPANSSLITANAAVKAGDSFYVKTSPNGGQTAITISATDTLATLATKLNSALGSAGKASVVSTGADSEIEITPSNPSAYIELDPQPTAGGAFATTAKSSNDVLAALGLGAGVIRTVKTVSGVTDVSQLREYGLRLPPNLNLDTAPDAQSAVSALRSAIAAVQQAYQDLVDPPTIASEEADKADNTGEAIPAYLSNEIANYQAGLQRLEGGG